MLVDMPTLENLERFIARVEQDAHAEAVEEFYAPDAFPQENQERPRSTRVEEVACQRWDGDRIVEETFFYDPAERTRK
jgi:hypothetical protein